MFTRGYVTITSLVTPDDPQALAAWFADLEQGGNVVAQSLLHQLAARIAA
jgi:hypothetical protein